MRYLALATDYDGTLATHGRVDEATLATLGRLRDSGRRLILVTGRELDELLEVFPQVNLFDRVVAENGALLYRPATREEKLLGERPPAAFVDALRRAGVAPMSVGRVIVATWEPHQTTVLSVIHDLGLELQVIFNKGAVMVLPSGVNKATGLDAALGELGLSPHNTVAVGDAENDHAFLSHCEFSVAVSNALPMVKERVDLVTSQSHGAGVSELIDAMLADDLKRYGHLLGRHAIRLGTHADGTEERVPPYGENLLLAGTSGTGKSTMTTGFLERLAEAGYQYVVVDPEGDYAALDGAVNLGDAGREPLVDEVLELLADPTQNAVVNLLGIAVEHRPAFFEGLLPRLFELRSRTGRPHWIVIDEAHHLLPTSWDSATLPQQIQGLFLITVHAESVAPALLASVDLVLTMGAAPEQTIRGFCQAVGQSPPALRVAELEPGEILAWRRRTKDAPFRIRGEPSHTERRRHLRKYAEGDLGPDRSFYFRGPEGKLNLQAQNLRLFLQMAEGVGDETWLHHLGRGDYSTWLREKIKDADLAAEVGRLEQTLASAPAADSRAAIRAAIDRRYTLTSEPQEVARAH